MRSLNEVIIAVQHSQPVTEEELKLALLALRSTNIRTEHVLTHLLHLLEKHLPLRKMSVSRMARQEFELCLKWAHECKKTDLSKLLTPEFIPGTPENEKWHKIAHKVLEQALDRITK